MTRKALRAGMTKKQWERETLARFGVLGFTFWLLYLPFAAIDWFLGIKRTNKPYTLTKWESSPSKEE